MSTVLAMNTAGAESIQANGSSIFVVPDHAAANATTTATYNMSAETSTGENTAVVKYDYIYDYELPSAAAAAAFCNAFDVSGANAYNQGANSDQSAAFADNANTIRDILVAALAAAKAAAVQTSQAGADLVSSDDSVALDEEIDETLTKRFNHFINNVVDSEFDSAYYPTAVAGNPGAPSVQVDGADIDIALDEDSGVASLQRTAAATAAVAADGPLNSSATTLALQIPGSNMVLYADASGNLPTALLLKGGDTVILGFSVTLDAATTTCTQLSGNATNVGVAADSHPDQLNAGSLSVTNALRPVEIAVRLIMPGSGAITGVRAVGA
jgi:hypothetical protein